MNEYNLALAELNKALENYTATVTNLFKGVSEQLAEINNKIGEEGGQCRNCETPVKGGEDVSNCSNCGD